MPVSVADYPAAVIGNFQADCCCLVVTGMLAPTEGTIRVLAEAPGTQLAKVGFVAQETPAYAGLSIADHLKLGAHLNPGWDPAYAQARIERLGLDPRRKAGKLSGGQRAQLGLTMAIAKRPELLILDEPVAALDPLARRGFMVSPRKTWSSPTWRQHHDLARLLSWWAAPIDRVGGFPIGTSQLSRFDPIVFGTRGIVPIGAAALAFMIGVTAGLLVRRTIPAMGLTLAVFAAALVSMPLWISPHLITPAQYTRPVVANLGAMQMTSSGQLNDPVRSLPGAWILTDQITTAQGKVFSLPQVAACQTGTQAQCDAYLAKQSLRQHVVYQPASRYWAFQLLETVIWLAIAAALVGFCTWRIRRPA